MPNAIYRTQRFIYTPATPPTPNFTGTPLTGTVPVTVTFTDTSTGDITDWLWDFGDGTTSTLQNPTHTYSVAGTYTVVLTTNGAGGSASKTQSNYLTYLPATNPSEYSDPDWLSRKNEASVIAAHAFDYDAEITQHLVGSTDPTDHPVPVRRVIDDAGYGCLEQVVLGAELSAAYTAGSSTMSINDDYLWPDPAVTGPFYFIVAKAYPSSPDKNVFLCTAKTKTYPKGANLTVAYQSGYGSAFASTPQNYSIGDYAGNENSREWRRTFSALIAGDNGLPTNDNAASGAVPLRSKSATGTYGVPRDTAYWQYGWYGHPNNQAIWANWTPWVGSTTYTPRGTANGAAQKYKLWDGDTIHIQFRMKVPRRFALYHQQPANTEQYWVRKTFAVQSEVSSLNQLVVDVGPPNIWAIPDTPQYPFRLGTYKDSKTIGVDDYPSRSHVSYQMNSGWDVAPYYANLTTSNRPAVGCATPDGAAAWKIPDEEWVTFYLRIKPGRSGFAETEIDVKFARQDHPDYTGSYTTLLSVTDARIIYSGSGDIDFPDGLFDSSTVARMDALPGYQSFGLMGYLNLFQAAGWVPPKASYAIRMSQIIFSKGPIAAPAAKAKPSWLSSATARTWISIPQTTSFASLDVTSNPTIVPSGADWAVNGYTRIFAWCGHTWDDINRQFCAAYQGGHNDYGGNDVLKYTISNTSTWSRIKLPSGCLPGPALVSFSTATGDMSGRYPDGTLRCAHTYHNHKFIPGYGHTIIRARGMYPFAADGSGSGLQRVWTIDPETGFDVERCDFTSMVIGGSSESAFDYDSTRNVIWHLGSGTSKWVKFSNLSAKTWTATDMSSAPGLPRDNYMPNSGVIRYVASADKIAVFPVYAGLGTGCIGIMNPATLTWTTPSMSGSFAPGFTLPDSASGSQAGCGMEWNNTLGCFLLWNNETATTVISTLTPSNPSDWTQPWVRGTLSVDGSNSVTPTATVSSGTFGRATYSKSLNAFLVHPTYTSNVYAFKL